MKPVDRAGADIGAVRIKLAWLAIVVALVGTAAHAQPMSCTAPPSVGAGSATGGGVLNALLAAADGGASRSCVPVEPASVVQQAPSSVAGNPVDVLTGAKLDRAVDFYVPSAAARVDGSAEFVFTRLYSSESAGSAALGPGWRLGFDARLYAARVGARVVPEIVQGDGRRIRFGSPSVRADRAVIHRAQAPGDGVLEQAARAAPGRERWVWRWPDGRALSFDAVGRLHRIASQHGPAIALEYDSADRLVAVESSAAIRVRLRYHATAAGRLASVSDGARVRVRYDFDDLGRLARVAYADGAAVRYRYEGTGARLASVEMPDGSSSEYRYGADGRVVYARAPANAESGALRFRYQASPGATGAGTTFVAQGNVERARYHWAPVGRPGTLRLISAQGAGCDHCPATGWRYAYTTHGELDTLARDGQRLRVARDAQGTPVALDWLDPSARRVAVASQAGERADAVVLADGSRVVRRRDTQGRVVAITGPRAARSVRDWDRHDRLVAERHADGSSAQLHYDELGRLLAHVERSGDGGETKTTLRWAGGEIAEFDHPEQTERFERDASARVVARHLLLRLDAGTTSRFTLRYRYDDGGRLVAWSLPAGGWVHAVRDAAGQVVALDWQPTDGEWRVPIAAALERDAVGLRRMVLGNRVVVDFTRDASGALLRRREVFASRFGRASAPRGWPIDARYQFDSAGRLQAWSRENASRRYAYDDRGQLVQAMESAGAAERAWRYAYDANGNRRFAAEPGREAAQRSDWQHDAAGRVVRDAQREYAWDAGGRLSEVRRQGRTVASYRYNHRGERVAKRVDGVVTHFLYDAQRRVLAELDARGLVRRQYLYLADLPVAVLDRVAQPGGEHGGEQAARFVPRYLHLNHLGAPEAASDARGRLIWHADYAPFGRRLGRTQPNFELALRLPGQYEDAETGLHYNDHRYYDPDAGRYLSPDPLGLAAGSNVYAYAGNNPLTNIDPSGLALFAFDGTDNSDTPPRRDDFSNVYKLAHSYAGGRVWYMAGVGQYDVASGIAPGFADAITAASARSRVDFLLGELAAAAAASARTGSWFDVDIIGFSRGAAMARDFSNRVADRIRTGVYAQVGACVRLRFLGLWDTVAQFGPDGIANAAWKLAVPTEVAYAAHAVALNEHRTLFPLESIVGSPLAGVRIERGFVGAHSDVGGSYAEGDLSDVALVWMYEQSRLAGLRMFALTSEYARVTAPLLHDSTLGRNSDREVFYRNSFGWIAANPLQRVARIDGMQWRETAPFIRRYATPQLDVYGEPSLAGLVDIVAYSDWLDANYSIRVSGVE